MANILGTSASETIDALDGVTGGADSIFGFDGNDLIFGLGGNDIILGGTGADTIHGGVGTDTASYTDSSEGVSVNLASGTGFDGTAEGDTLISIENLIGSAHDDFLAGNSGDNVLKGQDGDDILAGGGGDDTFHGGAGADLLSGGSGIDTVSYVNASSGVNVSLRTGSGMGGDAEGDAFISVENLTGSGNDDILWGDDGDNVLAGNEGDDNLKGFGGTDTISGGSGNDIVWGMDGDDTLFGVSGGDTIYGGAGRDALYGGENADVFRWDATSETGTTTATADTIVDFDRPEGDEIDLSSIDADIYTAGNQAFTFIGTADFSGTPGEVRYYQSGGNTYIEMQTGTSVDVEGMIKLTGLHTPTASWFVL